MQAAIIGDIYGSIYEDIPNLPLRSNPAPTDDSFLTAAAFEWMQQDVIPHVSSTQERLSSHQYETLGFLSIESMIRWFDAFPYQHAFSPGFCKWVHSQRANRHLNPEHQGHTNGILMRQSPIIWIAHQQGFCHSLTMDLVHCFGTRTHNHPDAIKAAQTHAQMLLDAYDNPLLMHQRLLEHHYGRIYPLSHWSQYKHFIYDAKTSLLIVLGLLAQAHDFEHFLQLVTLVRKDADTYLAIGAPIASVLWQIKAQRIQWAQDILTKTPDLHRIFIQMGTTSPSKTQQPNAFTNL